MIIKSILGNLINKILAIQLLNEFNNQKFSAINERPIEYNFLFKMLTINKIHTIVDIGTGKSPLPKLLSNCGYIVDSIDNIKDYWPKGMMNKHYHVIDGDITNIEIIKKFDLVTCISVIEHIENYESAVESMAKMTKKNGYLLITCPYTENNYCPDVYKNIDSSQYLKNIPFKTQSYSRNTLPDLIIKNGLTIVEQEYWQFYTGNYWTCGDQLPIPIKVNKDNRHQLTCILAKNI